MTQNMMSLRRHAAQGRAAARSAVRGLTLVELMIAMMLGLLVVGSASAIFISNRATYRATEGLGRVQENGRMAFELMARDLREAGGNPCGNADRKEPLKIVNVLNNPAAQWWTNWNNGIRGYEAAIPGGNPPGRVVGADAIDLMSADSSSAATIVDHNIAGTEFELNTADHGFKDSDLAIVCDWRQASLFQVTSVAGANIRHSNAGAAPGNCTKGLGYANPALCTPGGRTKQYGPNPADNMASATVVRMQPVRWYVGTAPNGGRSLFRSAVVNNGGALAVREQEIAEGVNDLEIQYLLEGAANYVDATLIPADRWNDVNAVRVTLDMLSADGAGVGGAQLQRRIAHTVTLRNRME
ncbi:MAG: type IV pilus assembly protein PilW [Lysobacter sp.]|nr:type IV pilus assembly protein PilW [Lysobacter sp.]